MPPVAVDVRENKRDPPSGNGCVLKDAPVPLAVTASKEAS
jgi:hypothetical protein